MRSVRDARPLSRRRALAALAALLAGSALAVEAPAKGEPKPLFLFFWAVGCPHCAKAMPLVEKLERQHRDVRFERYEVKKDKVGRRRFAKEVKRLGIEDPGVPTFVCGDEYVMGWLDDTEQRVRQMLARCRKRAK